MHSFLWCVNKVPYPFLDQHVARIVAPLLLLLDDYETEHKLLGLMTLSRVIGNVNPSQMRLHNHHAVIYDALAHHLFASESSIHEATLNCLLGLLPVLHSKSEVVSGIAFTPWDKTFEKLVENIEMTSKMEVELVLLRFIPMFVEKMGGNMMKHLDRSIQLISLPIHGRGTQV